MLDLKTYQGSCHCGAVRFSVDMALEKLIACNCSMCHRAGSLLAFVPAEKFTLISGTNVLTNYQFNKKIIDHLFCSVCGIKPFGRGKGHSGEDMIAVNVRCLDNVDIKDFDITEFDGKNM